MKDTSLFVRFCYNAPMATLYTQQEKNISKTWFFLMGFFGLVLAVGWVFAQVNDNPAILVFAVILAIVMNLGAFWFSDSIVLRMVNAQQVEKKEDAPELWNIVENLSITAGLPMPKVYIVEDPSPNAFATGRNPEHAALAVHTGLLKILNRSELEGVLAHELSHVGNRDTLISTIAVVLAGMIAILSDWMLRSMFWGGGRRRGNDSEGGNGLMLILGIVVAILAPLFATMMKLAISRKREFLADASGALLTRYPEGLASALEKIEGLHAESTTANSATATLYFANPFEGSGRFIAKLFATHPPTEERIAALRGMQK
jgi:heat shock protein HtpX